MKKPLFTVKINGKTRLKPKAKKHLEKVMADRLEDVFTLQRMESAGRINKLTQAERSLAKAANRARIAQQFKGVPPFETPLSEKDKEHIRVARIQVNEVKKMFSK